MKNERIVNLIINVKTNADQQMESIKKKFSTFWDKFKSAAGAVNNLLMVQAGLWVKLNVRLMETFGTLGFGVLILTKMMPLLKQMTHGFFNIWKTILMWVVAFHIFKKVFANFIDAAINQLKEFFKWLHKIGLLTTKQTHEINKRLGMIKKAEPFEFIAKKVENLAKKLRGVRGEFDKTESAMRRFFMGTKTVKDDQGNVKEEGKGGMLPGIMNMFAKTIASPKLAAGLLAAGAAVTALTEGFKLALDFSMKWIEMTIHGMMKIIELGVQVGAVVAGAMMEIMKAGIEANSEMEKLQNQLTAVMATTTVRGTSTALTDVGKAAADRIKEIKDISQKLVGVSGGDVAAGIIESQVLGTLDEFAKRGIDQEKLASVVNDMMHQFNLSFGEAMNMMNNAALGRFVQMKRVGITKGKAEAAGGGDAITGMIKLLEERTKGAAARVKNTWEIALQDIRKIWDGTIRDMTLPAFQNLEAFVVEVRNYIEALVKSDIWQTAKKNIANIFAGFANLTKSGIMPRLHSMIMRFLKAFNSPQVQQTLQSLVAGFQLLVTYAVKLVEVIAEEFAGALPGIASFWDEIVIYATAFFMMITDNFPKIWELAKDFLNKLIKGWAFVTNHVIIFLKMVFNAADWMFSGIQDFVRRLLKSWYMLTQGMSEETFDAVWNATVESNIQAIRDGIYGTADAMQELTENIAAGKSPLEALGMAADKFLSGQMTLQEYIDKTRKLRDEQRKAGDAATEAAEKARKKEESVGEAAEMTADTVGMLLDLYTEMGSAQGIKGLFHEDKKMGALIGGQMKDLQEIMKRFNDDKRTQHLNEDIADAVESLQKLRENIDKVVAAWESMLEVARTFNDATYNAINDLDAPFSKATEAVYKQRIALIQTEKAAARAKMKIYEAMGDFKKMSQAYAEYIGKMVEEKKMLDELHEKQFKYRKEGLEGLRGMIEAQRQLISTFYEDMGPGADYQAQRALMQEEMQVLKAKLEMLQEEQKINEQMNEQYGDYVNKLIDGNTEIIKTKAEMLKIEKTLNNIAKPSLLEQIVGAPQRILNLLPTANQLGNKARTALSEQSKGVTGMGKGFTIIQAPPSQGVQGGMFPAGALGTKFMPSHVTGSPESIEGQTGSKVSEWIKKSKEAKSKLGDQIAEEGNKIAEKTYNINATVNVEVKDFEKDLDKILPEVKKIVSALYQAERRKDSRFPKQK